MTNYTGEKILGHNIPILVFLTVMLITAVTETTIAESLYIIADINGNPTPIRVYNIADDGTLSFQAVHYIPHYMQGAVGLTIDSGSKTLFVTSEASGRIQMVNATTMTFLGYAYAGEANNLAGIVYDDKKDLLYCVDRGTDTLYVFNWKASTATLTPVSGSPFTLMGATAYGIALDIINDLLYVANNNTYIRIYHTSDWSLAKTISVSHPSVGIAIDDTRGFLYFGGKYYESDNYDFTQYKLATGIEAAVQVDPNAGVFGIAVDAATGFVYISTGRNNAEGGDNIQVYDTALNQIDVVNVGGNPTGLTIPRKYIHYNHLHLSKNIIGSETDEVRSASIGDTIIYNICFDNKDNDYSVTNVSIVDALPHGVSFITADGDGVFGQYDPITHTYTWYYSSLAPGFQGDCLKLVVQVDSDAAPGITITNSATIDSDETGSTTASSSFDVVTESISYNPLNLSKSIVGGTIEQTAISKIGYAEVGDTIIYGICFDNKGNNYTINNVLIIDTLPKEVSFVTADGDGVFRYYDPITHTYTWYYSSLAPGFQGNCLKLVVQVDSDATPGTTITNSVTIDSDETGPTTATVDVVTLRSPLEADLSVRPNMIRRVSCCQGILAIVRLPQGVDTNDIKDEPLILNPGNTRASHQLILSTAGRAEIQAWFDITGLMAAVPGYGETTVQVVGKLKSGQSFIGEDVIYITKFVGG